MATPFVAGVAALYAGEHSGRRGAALSALLLQNAKPLDMPQRDVGAGLVQAP
jgi:subtilisin